MASAFLFSWPVGLNKAWAFFLKKYIILYYVILCYIILYYIIFIKLVWCTIFPVVFSLKCAFVDVVCGGAYKLFYCT